MTPCRFTTVATEPCPVLLGGGGKGRGDGATMTKKGERDPKPSFMKNTYLFVECFFLQSSVDPEGVISPPHFWAAMPWPIFSHSTRFHIQRRLEQPTRTLTGEAHPIFDYGVDLGRCTLDMPLAVVKEAPFQLVFCATRYARGCLRYSISDIWVL